MIESIHIQNFQCHRDLYLEFSSGLNVVVGPSDTGKSAILRAIYWVLTNKPSGNSYINNDAKKIRGAETRVSVVVDGVKITRKRKGVENTYILDGKKFKAVGTSVPEEVASFLNISDVNIQRQLDAPFLLSESPGQVGRKLNEIVDLEKIDHSLKRIASLYREETQQISFQQGELESVEEELKRYDWVSEAAGDLNHLEILNIAVEDLRASIDYLKKLVVEGKSLERDLSDLPDVQEFNKEYTNIKQIASDVVVLSDNVNKLSRLFSRVRKVRVAVSEWEEEVSDLTSTFHDLMPDVCPLCGSEVANEN